MVARRFFLSIAGMAFIAGRQPVAAATRPAKAPALMLANVYREGTQLADYWVSEKFDGVRGYWDGQALWTRGGERVHAPAWFTAGWPGQPMDGELWAGHGKFGHAASTVRQQTPVDAAWRMVRYQVFDLPARTVPFSDRIPALQTVVGSIDQAWVQAVPQSRVSNLQALRGLLDSTVKHGGEGLMLHRGSALYQGVRSDDLLKLKLYQDSEARVVGHMAGQGRHTGRLGALLVEMPAEGNQPARRFKLGSGFTDAQRQSPPAIGSMVTYRFRGVNESSIPRFASFLRISEN